MVREQIGEPVEPPGRHGREDAALVGDGRGQYEVVRGDAVAGHNKDELVVDVVQLADLAGVRQWVVGKLRDHAPDPPLFLQRSWGRDRDVRRVIDATP